ncbi:PREDICTED: protein PHLOEM PROTEIN 2-LIKE A5-like isoform X3 [Camelina sativa]|nr:PREDICTED: protein PHLOEM PROTEIN 2-LIKE A5-like isoform X3 [Camelina sativa]
MSYMTVSPAKKVHQVFLNFRGEELRYNFVSHLGDAFERHNIKLFVDKYEQRGKDLKNLFVRIEESSIALAIFSTRYPESRWCMDELVKMNKLADLGKLRVIPIFYKVEAGDVRKQTGDSEFGKNFWRLAEASSGDQIKKWKEALEGITNKMGLSLGDNSVESDSVKEIVEGVQRVIELIGLEEEVRSPI